jgi:hypothetical protein
VKPTNVMKLINRTNCRDRVFLRALMKTVDSEGGFESSWSKYDRVLFPKGWICIELERRRVWTDMISDDQLRMTNWGVSLSGLLQHPDPWHFTPDGQ